MEIREEPDEEACDKAKSPEEEDPCHLCAAYTCLNCSGPKSVSLCLYIALVTNLHLYIGQVLNSRNICYISLVMTAKTHVIHGSETVD